MILIQTFPGSVFQAAELIDQGDGRVTVRWPIGRETETVMSVQPDGTFTTRAAGTAGDYEVARPLYPVDVAAANWLIFGPYAQPHGRPDQYYTVLMLQGAA